jgi:HK97 family phage portal protein
MLRRLAQLLGYEKRALDELSGFALVAHQPTAAGQSVTPETALQSPTALAAVRAIAETVGVLPVHLFTRESDGSRERDRNHPAAQLIGGFANDWTSTSELRTQLTTDAILHRHGGFAQVVRVRGRVAELHRLAPRSVTIELKDDGEPTYKVSSQSGGTRVLAHNEVLHVAAPGWCADRPMGLIDLCREAIGIDIAMARHQGNFFNKGGRPSGVLSLTKTLRPEAIDRLRDAWNKAHGGQNSGGTAVLEEGVTFSQISSSFVDSQFLELRVFVVQEIARALRVPAPFVNDLTKMTFNNAEFQGRIFLTYCLLPWLKQWQGALTKTLLTPDERKSTFLEFQTADLLRGDLAGRSKALREATGGAIMTRNEARQLENLPPVDGADDLLMQAGQTPDNGDTDA